MTAKRILIWKTKGDSDMVAFGCAARVRSSRGRRLSRGAGTGSSMCGGFDVGRLDAADMSGSETDSIA